MAPGAVRFLSNFRGMAPGGGFRAVLPAVGPCLLYLCYQTSYAPASLAQATDLQGFSALPAGPGDSGTPKRRFPSPDRPTPEPRSVPPARAPGHAVLDRVARAA
jgi:hypothetical protein